MIKITPIAIALLVAGPLARAADEPEELTKLRESYQQAQERALAPLQAKYVTSLESMKLKLTKAGKLQDALAVDAELKAVTAKPDKKPEEPKAGNDPENLIGEWYCNGVVTDVYKIRKGNKAQHMGTKGEWKYEGGLFMISWENGYRLIIDSEQKGDNIQGRSYPPGTNRVDLLQFTRK